MAKDIGQIFGERLRALREKAGLTQEQLAKELNISRASLGYYEGGRAPNIDTLDLAAKYFKVPLGYLMGRTSAIQEENIPVCDYLGISEKAAENLRKNAGGYWKPLNSVLENESFWQLLIIMESYSNACLNENLGITINDMVFSTAKMLLPNPEMIDLIHINKAFFQGVFSQYIMRIANDYSRECFGKDGDTNGKHKQEDE